MSFSLDFKAFKASNNKVHLVDFHPVQPWLAMADKAGTVTVWNWSTEQVVYEAQLEGGDTLGMQDALIQRLAEKDSQFYGPQISGTLTVAKSAAAGAIKDIKFLDTDTCFWQLTQQQTMQHKAHTDLTPHLGKIRGLHGHRWLVVACDTKLLMHDLSSNLSREVARTALDNKAPTSVAFLYINNPGLLGSGVASNPNQLVMTPVIAVGTATGQIYIISVSSGQVCAKCQVQGHTKAVTALLPLSNPRPGGGDMLISASLDGNLLVWDPSTMLPRGPEKEITSKLAIKAHADGVLSMALFQAAIETPDAQPLHLCTAGGDNKTSVWDVATWKEVPTGRGKPFAKHPVTSVVYSSRAGTSSLATPSLLLSSDEGPAIWGMYSNNGRVEQLISLESLLPNGQKKVPKVYQIACHPLQPHLIAVAANAGCAILSFDAYQLPAIQPVPLLLATPADLDSPLDSAISEMGPTFDTGFKGASYLMVHAGQLWNIQYKTGWRQDAKGTGRELTTDLKAKKSIAKLNFSGLAVLRMSSNGRCCSIVWPEARRYAVYAQGGSDDWHKVDEESGTSVAWAGASSTYAVLHQPRAVQIDQRVTSKKKSKVKEQEAAIQAAQRAAEADAAASVTVKIYCVNETGASISLECSQVDLAGQRPTGLHGGALLGIAVGRHIKSGSRSGHAMQFYSWQQFRPVGPPMVEPKWVQWDPDVTVAALAYSDSLELYRARPTFKAMASLSIQEALSGVWSRHQLFVATHTALHCIFVAANPESPQPFLDVIKLASLQGGIISELTAAAQPTAALPSEALQCAGPLVVVGIREGSLWLVDSHGQPFVVPVNHPGLKARCLSAQGDSQAARMLAERDVWRQHHDELAGFMAAMAPDGAAQAVNLTGLTLKGEMDMALRIGQYRRALNCLEALARGAEDRATLNVFPRWHDHGLEAAQGGFGNRGQQPWMPGQSMTLTNPGLETLKAGGPLSEDLFAGDTPVPASNGRKQAESNMAPAFGGSAVDWDAPLAAFAPLQPSGPSVASAMPFSELGELTGVPQHAQQAPLSLPSVPQLKAKSALGAFAAQRVAGLAPQALDLVTNALAAGRREIAEAALRILLQASSALRPADLSEVLVHCAHLDLKEDITSFAQRLTTDANIAVNPAVPALAAMLANNQDLAHACFEASGMVNSAAVYTHAWRGGNAMASLQDWATALTKANSPNMHVNVVPAG